MTILAIMVVTLFGVFIYGFNSMSRTRQITLATQILQEQMDAIRNLPFDTVAALGTTYANDKLSRLQSSVASQAIQAGPGNDIKKVTVSVSWVYRGQTLVKDIVTYVTRMGVDKK